MDEMDDATEEAVFGGEIAEEVEDGLNKAAELLNKAAELMGGEKLMKSLQEKAVVVTVVTVVKDCQVQRKKD